MEKLLFAVLVIIFLGAAVYVWHSGILQQTANDFSGRGGAAGFFSIFGPSPSDFSVTPTSSSGRGGRTVIGAPGSPQGRPPINPSDIPAGYTANQLSPFFGEFGLSGVSGGGSIVIRTALPSGESVDVTGWHMKGNRGGEFIPQAIAVYDPSGITPQSDIYLHDRDELVLYPNSAPFNVRLNVCLGYLNETNQFDPPFPNDCPRPSRSEIQSFSGTCQDYITSLGTCEIGDSGDARRVPQNDYACRTYIDNHFNYHSCFTMNVNKPGFLFNEVNVWMGSNPFDPDHDVVGLFDRNGLLVDQLIY